MKIWRGRGNYKEDNSQPDKIEKDCLPNNLKEKLIVRDINSFQKLKPAVAYTNNS